MQALIKKGSHEKPVWGWVRFQADGWKIASSEEKVFVFTDTTTIETIDSLTKNQASEEGYELVKISVTIP